MDRPFPILRWVAVCFLAAWVPSYVVYWGPSDLLYLCNVAVVLTCAGLWFGNSLLLSSQAVATMVIGTLWCVDVAWVALTQRQPLIGGVEYMWDAQTPLWLRLLSFDHLAAPVVTLWGVRKVGYDRRAWAFQSAVAAVVLVASRIVAPGRNLNFGEKELVTSHTWGPPTVHLLFIWSMLVLVVYWPVHAVLMRVMPARRA